MLLTPKKIILRTDFLCGKILPTLDYKIALMQSHSFMTKHPDLWLWEEDPLDDFVHQLFLFGDDKDAASHFIKSTNLALIAWFEYNLKLSKNHILEKDPLEQTNVPDEDESFLLSLLVPGLL